MQHHKNNKKYDIHCISTVTGYIFFIPLVICLIFFALILFSGCTYSVNLIHSQGTSTDLIDETQTTDPKIDPNLNIPSGPIL